MRLESALNAGREGITVHGQAISVIGDNIANSSTTGFKGSRTEFSDMLSDGAGGLQSTNIEYGGTGVELSNVRTLLSNNGTIEPTGRALDAAVDGNGFFVTGSATDTRYTRAGNFSLDGSGNLLSASGAPVLGYAPGSTALSALNLYNVGTSGSATTTATLSGNIDATLATAQVPTAPASFNEINKAATFTAPISVYDSLGTERDLTVAFYKTAPGKYTVTAYADGNDVGGTKGKPVSVGSTTIQFDENGAITGTSVLTGTPAWNNGAAAGNFTLDLAGFTQFATTSNLSSVTQNGLAVGNVKNYEIDTKGGIFAVLDSGQRKAIGSLALANFRNLDGLSRSGSLEFRANDQAGEITLGTAGSGSFGKIQGSALERSTVDISEEFVNLILYQRGYQANSQTLSAANDLLKETLGLIR